MKRLPSSSSPMCAPLLLLCVATYSLWSAPATIKVDVSRPGHALSPMLYGIFFEDINCSADGGLYAEMVRNRNLEDSDKPDYWTTESSGAAVVAITLDSSNPASSKNPHSLRVQIANPGGRRAGVVNEGFWGMSLTKGDVYELSFLARAAKDFTAPLTASLESSSGTV